MKFPYRAVSNCSYGQGFSENEAIRALLFHGSTQFSRASLVVYRVDDEGVATPIDFEEGELDEFLEEIAYQLRDEAKALGQA